MASSASGRAPQRRPNGVAQSMMQSPTTMRRPPSVAPPSSAAGGKESQPSSDGSVRTAKCKRKGKIEVRKKKRGFGLFSKNDEPTGQVSQETPSVQQTPSTQLAANTADTPEPRVPLKMIDSLPNDKTKIVMKRFIQMTVAKGIQGILQEFTDIKATTTCAPTLLKKEAFDKHLDKNRYKDTYCLDETRVVLKWPEGNPNDYIHANWTQNLPEMPKDIICTQGPTEKTVDDFWRMIWQEKCICIIMLCGIMEGGKKKCEQYWPLKPGEKMVSAGLEIINKQTENIAPDCIYSHLLVIGQGSDGGKREHFVNHLMWTGWPDRGVPSTSTGILRLIVRTQSLQPVVVHCSAGIGRTGTIVALESCLRVLDSGMELSVYNIIKMLRAKRYNACQTDLQYCYLHRAVMAFIISKNVCAPSDIVGFVEDYEKLVKQKNAPPTTPKNDKAAE